MVPRDARALALLAAPAEGELQRRRGRPGRDPAARARREPALLRKRGGAGGPRRLPREAPAGLLALPASGPSVAAARGARRAHLGDGGARRARCRPRSRRCSSAPRWRSAPAHFDPLAFLAALLGALFIQVGTNLSNDYSDARRGADTEDRLGPVRVTAGGLVPPRQVLLATYVTLRPGGRLRRLPHRRRRLGAARRRRRLDPRRRALHGRSAPIRLRGARRAVRVPVLRRRRGRRLLLRAGPASCRGRRSSCAVPVGLLASAILVVNNVRDLDTDRRAGKRTLAVRLGRERTRGLYAAMLALAFLDGAAAAGCSAR